MATGPASHRHGASRRVGSARTLRVGFVFPGTTWKGPCHGERPRPMKAATFKRHRAGIDHWSSGIKGRSAVLLVGLVALVGVVGWMVGRGSGGSAADTRSEALPPVEMAGSVPGRKGVSAPEIEPLPPRARTKRIPGRERAEAFVGTATGEPGAVERAVGDSSKAELNLIGALARANVDGAAGPGRAVRAAPSGSHVGGAPPFRSQPFPPPAQAPHAHPALDPQPGPQPRPRRRPPAPRQRPPPTPLGTIDPARPPAPR